MAAENSTAKTLQSLFEAERTVRKLHDELSEANPTELLEQLESEIGEARKLGDDEEARLRLVRVSALLGEVGGGRAIDLLIDVLDSEAMEARASAGEQLEELAYERFKDVALGVERALKRLPAGSPALPELPYILAEIPEPGVLKLLSLYLTHEDADAVAAAIETIVEIGDEAVIDDLKKLTEDARTVEMDDDSGEAADKVSIGELAKEALELLEALQGELKTDA